MSLTRELYTAAVDGETADLRRLLEDGVCNINAADSVMTTAMFIL